MKKFFIRIKADSVSYPKLYWCGDGFWTRVKSRAKAFDTKEAAEAEMVETVKIEEVEPVSAEELEDA